MEKRGCFHKIGGGVVSTKYILLMATSVLLLLLACLACGTKTIQAKDLDIRDYGAVAGLNQHEVAFGNTAAINRTLATATHGDVVVVPDLTFYVAGGVYASNLTGVTLRIDGQVVAFTEMNDPCGVAWPLTDPHHYMHFIELVDSDNITITGIGLIDGQGIAWWNRYTLGCCGIQKPKLGSGCPNRPKLVVVTRSTRVLVENIEVSNSPSFNIQLNQVSDAEVRNVKVDTSRFDMRALKQQWHQQQLLLDGYMYSRASGPGALHTHTTLGLNPLDLNTDGIDASGTNIWIHDCVINNDDDSIAIKPLNKKDTFGPVKHALLHVV